MNRSARAALTVGRTSAILPRVPQSDASILHMRQFEKIESEKGGNL
jgi:hypothetical protein